MFCSHLKKTSEDTTIKNTISVDNLFKYIYTLISAVVYFKSKLVRTSIKINIYAIIDNDFSNVADHTGKRNWSIVVPHDTSVFFYLIIGTSTLAIKLSGREPLVNKLDKHWLRSSANNIHL